MIKDILAVFAGTIGLIVKFILILALSVGAVYCFGTAFMVPLVWGGLERLGIAAACGLGVFLLIRLSRDRDDGPPTEDDFRP